MARYYGDTTLESLKVSVQCGCRPKARHILLIVLRLRPECSAIDRVLQCVASRGWLSKVSANTRSTSSSMIARGAPVRDSPNSPSNPRSRNRLRHLPTVGLQTRNSCATAVLVLPAPHPSTIPCPQCQGLTGFRTACPLFHCLIFFLFQN